MSDPAPDFNPHSDEEYTPLKPRPRKPERVGQPRAARREDIAESMDRIVRDIIERDGPQLKWRGRGRR